MGDKNKENHRSMNTEKQTTECLGTYPNNSWQVDQHHPMKSWAFDT